MGLVMKVRFIGAALAVSLLVAAPAHAEKQVTTPSGRAEMVFPYTSLTDAVNAVQSKCMDKGWMVTQQTNNQVICEVPMGMWQSAFTQMMIGNSYSTTPKQFVRFSLAEVGGNTRVQVQGWAETQMAFGQVQQHQYTDDTSYDNYMGFLFESGAQLPVGSSFNGTAYLGMDFEPASWTNGKKQAYGERVKNIIERSPGYRMGLRDGDVIAKINGKTFKDQSGIRKLLDKQKVGNPINVTVIRDGVEQTFSATAEGRPPITALVHPRDIPQGVEGLNAVGAQVGVATFGSVEAWHAVVRDRNPNAAFASATPSVQTAAAVAPVESETDRLRRELAEAQAKLEAAEKASEPKTIPASTGPTTP
jgi:hypothetical protein